jgi:hypothetical protein
VPVSTATKNKLSLFQFGGRSTGDGATKKAVTSLISDDEKENRVAPVEHSTAAEPTGTTTDAAKSPESALPGNSRKDVPSTPAGRLALPDLIGMGDVRRAVQDVSPEDRIEWDQHSSNSSFAITQKKRARSSSPTSSPAVKTPSRFKDKGETLNPQLDPGSELWGRYSLNGSTPQGLPIPVLAHLMQTSSPQISKERTTPRTMPGFRRANSCGNQFPKRRRIGGPDEDVFTESDNLGPSKLSVLIERVHEGIAHSKQPHTEVECSDSHFASGGLLSGHDQNCTPLRQESLKEKTTQGPALHDPLNQPQTTENSLHPCRSEGSDYGEFDDDDLDDIALLDAISQPHEPHVCEDDASAETESRRTTPTNSPKRPNEKTDNNEFDDSDEDLFVADLENMVAKFDNQRPADVNEITTSHNQKGPVALETDSDDEFGDGGFDDLDFEIAEAAATISKPHSTSSFLPVRTQFP